MSSRTIFATVLIAATVPTTALGAAARKTTGVVYASVTHSEGSDLYVSGDFKDKLLGRGGIVYITRVSSGTTQGSFLVKARKITIYTSAGSLSGTGSATQTITPSSVTVSDGKFTLTKGTGKLKGHTLKGTFAGTQTSGVYKFGYSGTYR